MENIELRSMWYFRAIKDFASKVALTSSAPVCRISSLGAVCGVHDFAPWESLPTGTNRNRSVTKKMGTGRRGSKKYRHSEFLGAPYSGPMDLWVSQMIQGIVFFGFQLATISSSFNILRQKLYFLIPQLSQTCKLVMKKQCWCVCS